ncbi:MAG TPA: hypothetical protein EYN66_14575, partial [Myxococcales bacterium]|nr:hypothetical protein [Myxococcales bacterium]
MIGAVAVRTIDFAVIVVVGVVVADFFCCAAANGIGFAIEIAAVCKPVIIIVEVVVAVRLCIAAGTLRAGETVRVFAVNPSVTVIVDLVATVFV